MDKQYGLQIAAQIAEQDYLRFDRSISTQPGVLHDFREALLEKGFQFRYLHETLQYMPKEKDIIVPLVLQYFQYATEIEDKKTLLPWLYYNGLYQAVPVLIHEFETCSAEGRLLYGWELGDTLYKIRCKQYTKEYMEIIQKKNMVFQGKWSSCYSEQSNVMNLRLYCFLFCPMKISHCMFLQPWDKSEGWNIFLLLKHILIHQTAPVEKAPSLPLKEL